MVPTDETVERFRATFAELDTRAGRLDDRTGQAGKVLDLFESFFKLLDRRSGCEGRLAGIERDCRKFAEDVRTVVAELAPENATTTRCWSACDRHPRTTTARSRASRSGR